ncbi:CPBP family intramembrane glutamic endopeptidase [Clavibacter sepedonicus]|uniref:Integral membrane protein n=1 Tax=Clavibacter sepedonicus TaxID=31964 RepID=B0RCU2_CLASE|nr:MULTISPECIES: CPBP family intramembrane glutamic endopeptidase [Clavibacter]MBD5382226.1 CPBP family intramembrane metalloprotease [Clavibacter sp.]UUK65547.1 CPBP family intramembrane metalloprotease [Clavibacter sepedonicus]CAQ03032.1 putative integral membrane protein [Clavibacter sepedonicus]
MRTAEGSRRITGFVLLGITSVMMVPLVYGFARDASWFLGEEIGLARAESVSLVAWVAAAGVALAYVVGTSVAVPGVRPESFRWSGLKAIAVVSAVVSGIVEELVFRGLLMDALDAAGSSAALQVVVSALAFGVAHAVWGAFAGDLRLVLPTVVATTLLGGALAVVYLLADRTLLPVAIAHVAINLVIEPGLMLSVVSASRAGRPRRAGGGASPDRA